MSWDGYIALGVTDPSLDLTNFVETSFTGYLRMPFSFRDPNTGAGSAAAVQGVGDPIPFTATDPTMPATINCYGLFNGSMDVNPVLVYPLLQPATISTDTSPFTVNPFGVEIYIAAMRTVDGLPVSQVGVQQIAGISTFFVNSQGELVFDHDVVFNQKTTLVVPKGACPTYNVSAPSGWYKIGRYLTAQHGDHLKLSLSHGSGYSSNPLTSAETVAHFKTADGATNDANGFAGDCIWWRFGTHPGSVLGLKIVSDLPGQSATSYSFYINSAGGFGVSFLRVEAGTGTWFNEQTGLVASDPGAASSTVCIPDERWTVLSLPSLYGLSQIGSLANDAAAAAAGFPVGALYHTTGALKVRLT